MNNAKGKKIKKYYDFIDFIKCDLAFLEMLEIKSQISFEWLIWLFTE